MLPPVCVVVPTYWTRRGGETRSGDAIYDHPTVLDGPDTLSTLLESLQGAAGSFYLLVLVAVSGEDVAEPALGFVRELVGRYHELPSLVFGSPQLEALLTTLDGEGHSRATEYLKLRDYPTVRNLQLAVPLLLGSSAIVALDDDEIVTDPGFVEKATEPLGTAIDGKRVDGLSGYYLQEDGGIMLQLDPAKSRSVNIFDRKAAIMNQQTEAVEAAPGETVETPFCFGGNMEFSAELAATVGFDPGITRGEDIDYLINARLDGKSFFLRKDLRILHCPPHGGSYKDSSISKLTQDVVRFAYERWKVRASQQTPGLRPVTVDQLGQYPGRFLHDDLEEAAIDALQSAGYRGDAAEFVRTAVAEAPERFGRYLEFRDAWPRIQQTLQGSSALRNQFLRLVHGI